MQTLATTGLIGLLATILALVVMPLYVFMKSTTYKTRTVSLGGVILITSYAVFGLSETWILRAPVVAIFLVYLVVLMASLQEMRQKEEQDRVEYI